MPSLITYLYGGALSSHHILGLLYSIQPNCITTINVVLCRYTIIHGQCLSVGVGGYLLGGGVNALGATARHGFGAQQVIMMKVFEETINNNPLKTNLNIAGCVGRREPGHNY